MAFIEPCFGIGHNLSLICQMTSEDIKHQLIIIIGETRPTPMSAESRRGCFSFGVQDLGWVRVMTGVKQGDSGQRSKPAGLIN